MKHGVYLMPFVSRGPAVPVGPPLKSACKRGWSQPLLGLSFEDKGRESLF